MDRPRLAVKDIRDLPKQKAKLRAKVPQISLQEVRRQRLPFHEAIRYELCEAGCHESVNFLNELLELDEKEEITREPKLKNSNEVLKLLMTHLKEAEHQVKDESKKIKSYLNLSNALQALTHKFDWIVERVFQLALSSSKNVTIDGGFMQALVRFSYSKFLYSKLENVDRTLIQIEKAYELSASKTLWLIEETGVSLSKEVLNLYYQILLMKATGLISTDLNEAQITTLRAINIAKELNEASAIARCFYIYGTILRTNNQHIKAIDSFTCGLEHAAKVHNDFLICEGYYELAVTYKALNNLSNAERYVALTMRLSDKSELDEWHATALTLSAELSLMKEDFDAVVNVASVAQTIFINLGIHHKLQETKFLIAIAKAQKIFPDFLKSIYLSEQNPNQVYQLMRSHNMNVLVSDDKNSGSSKMETNPHIPRGNTNLSATVEEEENTTLDN